MLILATVRIKKIELKQYIFFFQLLAITFVVREANGSKWDGLTPWFSGSSCNCNGYSSRCFFDKELYELTGHGGHCLDCQGNRDGPNCERCKENYFQQNGEHCVACNCNEMGSRSRQCNIEGKCLCKPGVTGDKCDRCEQNHYDFGPDGCKECGCSVAGSLRNEPHCHPVSGACLCKENVEGRRCRECKPGFFSLDEENEYGCTPCFCYGQASVCKSAPGYSKVVTESGFARSNERWSAEDAVTRPASLSYNGVTQTIGVHAQAREPIYFVAPSKFLGDQRASYNQKLHFKLRIGEQGPQSTIEDIILQGAGLTITQPIFGQNNPLPNTQTQKYTFRLHEHSNHGWQPRLTSRDFMSVLANLTSIKIRGTFVPEGVGFLDDVQLETARRGAAGQPATWIETCTCPSGYVGQFCESCAHKYRHEPPNGGPFARCVPCNCNGHADSCEEDTGRCICQHNTEGENCERCAKGFYGNSLEGTPDDCKPCPCPDNGACIELGEGEEYVICLECPIGYGGPRCDLCSDGYFGDPSGKYGPPRSCQPCDCNSNVDPNAVGNCNRTTGECLKCIYNTGGAQCDQCLPGYYGDALAIPKGDCKPCQCYRAGTIETEGGPPLCDQLSGQCRCKPHVQGTNCDICEEGYYNIVSGEGCQSCNCDPIGSLDNACDISTGQCSCRPGTTGKECNVCAPYNYGFSIDGCKPCECDEIGSENLQCDPNGQCPCLENVEGRRCDRCKENKFDRQKGCLDCPACYNLVQDAADDHRAKLRELESVLNGIANSPTVIDDADFEKKLSDVQEKVKNLLDVATLGIGPHNLTERIEELRDRLNSVQQIFDNVDLLLNEADTLILEGKGNMTEGEETSEAARAELMKASDLIENEGKTALRKAIEKSDQFGQQNKKISEISQEARFLAGEHEKEARRIEEIAEKAANISTEAYEIAKDAVNKQRNTSEELENLKFEINKMDAKVNEVRARAEDSQNAANQAHLEALEVYREIDSLQLPEVTSNKLKEEAEFLTNEAIKIEKEANDLLKDHYDTWENLSNQIKESQVLLEKGEEQQDLANELLAQVDAARAKAKEAVAQGERVIKEAQDTYNILSDFEHKVHDSKTKAQDALKTFPEVTELIREAEQKTREARTALYGAEQNAIEARDIAKRAQTENAEKASELAEKIKSEAEETKKQANKLRDEADDLSARVATTQTKLQQLEAQAEIDAKSAQEAKQRVGQAKVNMSDDSEQVVKALKQIEEILEELKDLPEIDEESLNDLERQLTEAENRIRDANLDERMQGLKTEKSAQTLLINNYQDEVNKLREEVGNIEKIASSLPEGCFKKEQKLEL